VKEMSFTKAEGTTILQFQHNNSFTAETLLATIQNSTYISE